MEIHTSTVMDPRKYLVFCKTYYAVKYKTARMLLSAAGILLLCAAMYMVCAARGNFVLFFICLWLGAFMTAYPHLMHRRTYKDMKKKGRTVYARFFDNSMIEKVDGERREVLYTDLQYVVEKDTCFIIINKTDSGILVDKEKLSEKDIAEMRQKFKSSVKYKRQKK